ncbi:MAG: ABC transporter substrate-binding protein [Candidatus ainarchaeum sp.]|nr:ABC transporter substrate-binding protein [Candidatus ainarchaeum sp.]
MDSRFSAIAAAIIIIAIVGVIGFGITGFFSLPSNENAIKIGAILPLTGKNARYGELEKTGLEMALQEINANNGINGKKLEIVYEDSQADAKQAIAAWRNIRLDSGVPLIISGLSNIGMALSPVANSDKTVLFATDCSAAQFSSANDFTFRITNSNAIEGEEMAVFLLSKSIDSIAVLKINNDYGEGLFPAFEKRFLLGNGKIEIFQAYSQEQRDFKTELSRIKESKAQAIYFISYGPDAEIIVKQIKEFGINLPLFAAEPIENNDFLKNSGEAAEGIIYLKAALAGIKGEEFAEKAKARIGRHPETNIARAYDLLYVASKAIQECDLAKNLNSQCVKEQLYKTSFEGVLGKISFDQNGDVHIPYALKIIKNGQFVLYENNQS